MGSRSFTGLDGARRRIKDWGKDYNETAQVHESNS